MEDTYTTKPGQHWDEIALAVYGSEIHADWLMEHNFPLLEYYAFAPGVVLQTPPLPEARRSLPPWRA